MSKLNKLPANRQNAYAIGAVVHSKGFVGLETQDGRCFKQPGKYEEKSRKMSKTAIWDMLKGRIETKLGKTGMTIRMSF